MIAKYIQFEDQFMSESIYGLGLLSCRHLLNPNPALGQSEVSYFILLTCGKCHF